MRTISRVLTEVAKRHPRLVLTDGNEEWTVEQLRNQAVADEGKSGRPGEEALRDIYFWGYSGDGSVSIVKSIRGEGSFPILTGVKGSFRRSSRMPSSGVVPVEFVD